MYISLNTNEAIEALLADTNASWTVEEARALVEYYEELEEATGEPIESDVVAIRCDWSCDTLEGIIEDYNILDEMQLETKEEQIQWLQDNTQVIELASNKVLYMQF